MLSQAIDAFFNGGGGSGSQVDEAKILGIFDGYKSEDGNIGVAGIEKFCSDLGIEPTDSIMLIISWHM